MVVGIVVGWAFPEGARDVHRGWAATDLNDAVVDLPAHDQVVDRAVAVRDAGRGNRRPRRRHEARRSAGVPFDRLLRDRDDDGAGGGSDRRESREAGSGRGPRQRVDEGCGGAGDDAPHADGRDRAYGSSELLRRAAKNEVLKIIFFAIIFAVARCRACRARARRSCSSSARACPKSCSSS